MKVYLPSGVVFAASFIESAAGDTILLRGLQQLTYHGHEHSLRVLSTADVEIPSAAPTIHPSVEKTSSLSAVPTAPLSESILDPSDNALSMSAATESDSATLSDSSTIPDNSQLEEEQESGLFGMSLFQTCAAVILIGMILGLFGHYGMKLLPYNRQRLREDNARNDVVQSEDSLASFRPHPHASVLNVGV